MRQVLRLCLALCVMATASGVEAEIPRSVILRAKTESLPETRQVPGILYGIQTSGPNWELVSVFLQPFAAGTSEVNAPKRWILRRQSGRGEEFSSWTNWADSADCPQIEGVLWSLSRLTVPSFEVEGISARRPPQGVSPLLLPADGPSFSIWGHGLQPNGAPAFMSLSGLGGELTEWGLLAERELAGCWSEDRPSG